MKLSLNLMSMGQGDSEGSETSPTVDPYLALHHKLALLEMWSLQTEPSSDSIDLVKRSPNAVFGLLAVESGMVWILDLQVLQAPVPSSTFIPFVCSLYTMSGALLYAKHAHDHCHCWTLTVVIAFCKRCLCVRACELFACASFLSLPSAYTFN